jgi:hypothetical protein
MLIVMVVVSAMFGYWVHWSREWIRQRHEEMDRRPRIFLFESIFHSGRSTWPAPGGLWLFGEGGVQIVHCIDDPSQEERERMRRIFPEAFFH